MNTMTNDERIEHERLESLALVMGTAVQAQSLHATAVKNGLIPSIDLFNACSVQPPALDFALPGMLKGTVGGYVSGGGVGKSMLALQLMMLKAGFDTLNGSFGAPKKEKCTILALEDPAIILHHRIHNIFKYARGDYEKGWSPKNAISAQTFADYCRIIPLLGTGFRVDDLTKGFDHICKYSEGQQLVFVDTFRRIHNKDENDNGEMAEILNIFERSAAVTGATYILLHHVPKGGNTARGASAITDNMRYLAVMRNLTEEEAEKLLIKKEEIWKHVVFSPEKSNYCAPTGALWFEKGAGGVLESRGKLDYWLDKSGVSGNTRGVKKRGGNGNAF